MVSDPVRDEDVVPRVELELREHIKRRQEAGITVTNTFIALRLEGVQPGSYYSSAQPRHALCLLGAAGFSMKAADDVDTDAASILKITNNEATLLESGFEGWYANDDANDDANKDNPFYKLGRKLGKELEDAAGVSREAPVP